MMARMMAARASSAFPAHQNREEHDILSFEVYPTGSKQAFPLDRWQISCYIPFIAD